MSQDVTDTVTKFESDFGIAPTAYAPLSGNPTPDLADQAAAILILRASGYDSEAALILNAINDSDLPISFGTGFVNAESFRHYVNLDWLDEDADESVYDLLLHLRPEFETLSLKRFMRDVGKGKIGQIDYFLTGAQVQPEEVG